MEEKIIPKKLTTDGIEEINIDVDIKPKETPISTEVKQQAVKNFNNDPKTQKYDAELVDKPTYRKQKQRLLFWKIMTIILVVILAIFVIWDGLNTSLGKHQSNSTLINNIDSPDINPTFTNQDTNNYQNNFTIVNNNTVELTIDLNENLSKEIAEKVMNEINWSEIINGTS